jgi:hypothetical protein
MRPLLGALWLVPLAVACRFDPSGIRSRADALPDQAVSDSRPDAPRSCANGSKDGTETDVDCGGGECPRCDVEKTCRGDDDCVTSFCNRKSVCALCAGASLAGFCWYLGDAGTSCDATCADHHGCDEKGTISYAGSSGTDDQCTEVAKRFDLRDKPHQPWSNNNLGCHLCGEYTYWAKSAPATTCAGFSEGCRRMCACSE